MHIKIYIFLFVFLMFSCSQDKKNDQTNDSIESTKVNTISENDVEEVDADEEMKQEIEIYENLKIVTPDQLTIDGYQRYFCNDTLFTGVSRQYEGDLLSFEIQFLNGRKHGVSTFWHENGQKKSILTFVNGKAKGDFKIWDKSGNVVKEGIN